MKDDSRSHVMNHQPWYLTLIQTLGVAVTVAVFVVMYLQLKALHDEQARTLRPYINIEQDMLYGQGGTENEIWDLAYAVTNSGHFPAKNVLYKMDQGPSPDFGTPATFDNTDPVVIPGYGGLLPIDKVYPRSDVLRILASGQRFYRHVYVQYQDDRGRKYYSRATWILPGYQMGVPVTWALIRSEGN
jgi:hypothetical protein